MSVNVPLFVCRIIVYAMGNTLFASSVTYLLSSAKLVHQLSVLVLLYNNIAIRMGFFMITAHASPVEDAVVFGKVQRKCSYPMFMASMHHSNWLFFIFFLKGLVRILNFFWHLLLFVAIYHCRGDSRVDMFQALGLRLVRVVTYHFNPYSASCVRPADNNVSNFRTEEWVAAQQFNIGEVCHWYLTLLIQFL